METYKKQILENFEKKINILLHKLEEEPNNQETINKINTQIEELNQILQTVDKKPIDFNNLCTTLLPLYKNKMFPSINTFLDTHHYLDKINDIIKKMQEQKKLNEKEEKYVMYYSKSQINIKNNNILFDLAILNSLFKTPPISYFLFKQFFIEQLKMLFPEKTLIIENHKNLGGCNKKFIYINEQYLYKLYEGKGISPMRTLYHEIRHGKQIKAMENPQDIYTIDMLKEDICINYIKGYYEENYERLIQENDAEYFSCECILKYCTQMNISLTKETIQALKEKKKMHRIKLQDKTRTINGIESSLETIFENLIKDKLDILKRHPSLTMLYKEENNMVIAKTVEECIEDAKALEQKTNITEEEKQKKRLLYKEILLNDYIENSYKKGAVL